MDIRTIRSSAEVARVVLFSVLQIYFMYILCCVAFELLGSLETISRK